MMDPGKMNKVIQLARTNEESLKERSSLKSIHHIHECFRSSYSDLV